MIYADTCIEWIVSALACFKIQCPVVTLYTNLGPDGIAYGITHVEPKLIITSHEMLSNLISILSESFKDKCCTNRIVYFDQPLPTGAKEVENGSLNNFNVTPLRYV